MAKAFQQARDMQVLFGDCYFVDEEGEITSLYRGVERSFDRKLKYWLDWDIPQPTVFVRREVVRQIGPLDETLKGPIDYEWFLRISERYRFVHAGCVLARYRQHSHSMTGDWEAVRTSFYKVDHQISRKYWGGPASLRFWHLWSSYLYFRLSDPFLRGWRGIKRALRRRWPSGE